MRKFDKKDVFLVLSVVAFGKVLILPSTFAVASLATVGILAFLSEYFDYSRKLAAVLKDMEEQKQEYRQKLESLDQTIKETKDIVSSIRLTAAGGGRNAVIFGK